MRQIRYFLYSSLIIIVVLLWNAWQKDHPNNYISPKNDITSVKRSQNYETVQKKINKKVDIKTPVSNKTITVKTNVLEVKIDLLGGNIVSSNLLKYHNKIKGKTPFTLLNNKENSFYTANSGLIDADDNPLPDLLYKSDKESYFLKNNKELKVQLKASTKNGIKVTKTFIFKPNKYVLDESLNINNQSNKDWSGGYYMQLNRVNNEEKSKHMGISSFFGFATSSPKKHYQKFSFKDLRKSEINEHVTHGWISMVQHYFLSSWVPDPTKNYHFYSTVNDNGVYTIGMDSTTKIIPHNESKTWKSKFYTGPKVASELDSVSQYLSLTIDYGWLWIISILIFKLLKFINSIVNNWGWSIVVVTIIIKLIFYHLSAASYKSMAGMRKLQPKINDLKERYGKDRQAMSQAMMGLYKKEKINPLGGCLPILIQIPVFIALYWVLIESVELRQSPFIFWIHDLSVKDPYYVLPVLMGVTMYLQQRLSPAPPDPTQAKIMMFLPVVMTVFFFNFPAGLVLYWLVNNTLSILQQWYIMKKYESGGYEKKRNKKK